jgi:DNA-directed DNA polymerase III PolC
MAEYAELTTMSNYTFLTGASFPEELVARAAALGHRAACLADTHTLAGIVRAHVAARDSEIPLVVGSRLLLTNDSGVGCDTIEVLVYPFTRGGYANLCRLLTLGKRRAPKGSCFLSAHDLIEHAEGMLAVIVPLRVLDEPFAEVVTGFGRVFDDDRLSVAMGRAYGSDDETRLEQIAGFCAHTGVPSVAVNEVRYHMPGRRELADVVTCIRWGCTIEQAGFRLDANSERFLKPPNEMAQMFAAHPGAVERSVQIVERACGFSLDELRYEYPAEPCPEGLSPSAYLRELTYKGARKRYPEGIPEKVTRLIENELSLIAELRYEAYFLTCADIISFARGRGILCQGRGGAGNSAVCFCLGITEVDPAHFDLLFARFISRERDEPPDIDIDFENERREEVIQYLYEKYGRDRAALTAVVITYKGRSAIREVGKVMGLGLDCVDTLAKNLDRYTRAPSAERVRECGLDPDDPTIARVLELTAEIIGFPRHLSQHVGGFVITRGPLCELVPIENAAMEDRTVIEWDKDDIDAMGMLKVDCLGLGMLTAVRKALVLLGGSHEDYAKIARNPADAAVFDMICDADTVGVFQIESRAQMSMLPRLKPRSFYDLVIEVAIVRPGPIQGDMVHPYLRRRNGEEVVSYPSEAMRAVLGRTLGVPLFQEQVMQISIVAGGFTPSEADQLRRAMAAWKRKGDTIYRFGDKLIKGMVERGYERVFAQRCFEQIKGFSEYGFPESHAAGFALIVYVSSHLKRYHPAAMCAALINSQPMGFYRPAQLVRDARDHGVTVRSVDVNLSDWDCTLEEVGGGLTAGDHELIGTSYRSTDPLRPSLCSATSPAGRGGGESCGGDDPARWGEGGAAVRLGLRMVKGLARADGQRVVDAVRRYGAFDSVERLWRISGVSVSGLRALARADAFGSLGLDRQGGLWAVRPLRDEPMPLFEGRDADEASVEGLLPEIEVSRKVLEDYASVGLSLKAHPMSFMRAMLAERGVIEAGELRDERACPSGRTVPVAGIVMCRQRPATASGVVFITLEDETGIVNLILWADIYERLRPVVRLATALLVRGRVERAGAVVHVHVAGAESLDGELPGLVARSRDFH